MSNRSLREDTPQRPLTPAQAYSPHYWRHRARQARSRAEHAEDQDIAAELSRIAADCERLAARAEAVRMADAAA